MQSEVLVNSNIICLFPFNCNLNNESIKIWITHYDATSTTQKVFGTVSFYSNCGYLTIAKTTLALSTYSEFTIDFRIFISSYTGNQKIFADGDGVTTANESLYISTEPDLTTGINRGLKLRTVGDGYDISIFTETLEANQFYHIAVVYYQGLFAFYVDGVFKSATTQAHALQDGLTMWGIGATPTGIQPLVTSYVDEFRIKDEAVWKEPFQVPTETYTTFVSTFFLPPLTYF